MLICSVPSCHLRLVRDQYNPTFHTLNVHAHGNIACDLQSTYQNAIQPLQIGVIM